MTHVRRDAHKRLEDKDAFMQSRVRKRQSWTIHDPLPVEKKVQIQGPGPPTYGATSMRCMLQLLEDLKEGQWAEICEKLNRGIGVMRLRRPDRSAEHDR